MKRSSPSRRCSHDELGSRARAHARSLARAQRLGAIYYTCCTEVVTSCDRIPQPAWPPLMPQMGAGRDRSRRLQRRHPAEAVVPSPSAVVGNTMPFVFFPQWTPLFLGRDFEIVPGVRSGLVCGGRGRAEGEVMRRGLLDEAQSSPRGAAPRKIVAVLLVLSMVAVMAVLFISAVRGGTATGLSQLLFGDTENLHDDDMGLFEAAQHNDLQKIKQLLQSDININKKTQGGWSALTFASSQGHDKSVKLLLDNGADPNHQSDRWSPLMWWSRSGHVEMVGLLLKKMTRKSINFQNGQGHTALFLAAAEGHTEAMHLLLEHNADPDLQGYKDGDTALMMAASSGNHEAVRAMLHAGADVEIQNSNGHTALHMAELDNKMHHRDDSARLLREHAVERVDQGRVWYEAKNKKGFKTHRHTHSEL